MESKFIFKVQQFERKEWRTKVETCDLNLACEQARQRSIATKERVRVVRVDTTELIYFHIY